MMFDDGFLFAGGLLSCVLRVTLYLLIRACLSGLVTLSSSYYFGLGGISCLLARILFSVGWTLKTLSLF